VVYGDGHELNPQELQEFYQRVAHDIGAGPEQIRRMLANSAVVVTARADGRLIGLARGIGDGVRAWFTECKLDPAYQGPAAVTRTNGRIEHDQAGIAAEMARRVLDKLFADGAQRVDVMAWGTEVDFLEELGFQRPGGLIGLTLRAEHYLATRGSPAPPEGSEDQKPAAGGHST